jgi:hypothetical protein
MAPPCFNNSACFATARKRILPLAPQAKLGLWPLLKIKKELGGKEIFIYPNDCGKIA